MPETVYTIWGFDFTTDYMTMLSSIFTGITTILFIRESYLMRKFQNMPEIAMYLKFAEATPALLYLIIENIGTGVARNVKFEFLKNYRFYKYPDDNLAEKGIIKSGLEHFYPKQSFKYFINHTSENWEEKSSEQIIIQVSHSGFFFTRKRKIFAMTVEQYAGGSHSKPGDTYPSHIAQSLEQLQKDISKLREIVENRSKKQ